MERDPLPPSRALLAWDLSAAAHKGGREELTVHWPVASGASTQTPRAPAKLRGAPLPSSYLAAGGADL